MTGAAPALLHHHGVSSRATLPVYHGNSRFVPGSCFLSKSTILGPLTVSLVCGASPNNHRPRNPDISRQQKRGSSSRGKSKPFQERDDSENNDEFDSDTVSSKNGPPISLTSNSRPHATSAPGEREKEIVELFKRVQAQLRARGKGREDKKPEPAKSQGERGSVDSLLNLLRRHSVDQKRKSSDEKEQNFDQTWRSSDSGNKQSSRIFGTKNDTQEGQKPPPATFQRPPSSFRRRSPVPGVKFQLVTNPDAGAKPVVNGMTEAGLEAKAPLEEEIAPDGPDSVSPYEPDSVIASEGASLDDFVVPDDESDLLDTSEPDDYLEPLDDVDDDVDDVADSSASHDDSQEGSPSVEVSDLSSLKVTELRELAKSRGLRGYSKMKKSDLVALLSDAS
ncbi:SAP-like protein BP-73 [Hordeum vulgare subsp. vulgare]|uniref:Rho termination factor-like N-terminal domain-containing protein n=1 Tax=Hordeum vulgare subsp. vulgare TaxID=112509 RepID=A0A8I6Y5Z8_HORVV|nr:SAP-like protein BP-73 [Hordeum vulgare subsp. vulgare]